MINPLYGKKLKRNDLRVNSGGGLRNRLWGCVCDGFAPNWGTIGVNPRDSLRSSLEAHHHPHEVAYP